MSMSISMIYQINEIEIFKTHFKTKILLNMSYQVLAEFQLNICNIL